MNDDASPDERILVVNDDAMRRRRIRRKEISDILVIAGIKELCTGK